MFSTWLALAALSPRSARADADQDRIAALIAESRSRDALPIARARAERLRDDVAAWEQLLTLAGWNSDQPAAIAALRNLVRLRPDDRDRRLALAQRLLWAHETREALPHVRWLMARPAERDPVALEVSAWVLLGEHDNEGAYRAARRWVAVAPTAAGPRRLLADLTHWTARWREAREHYQVLLTIPAERGFARDRLELLRHDHITEVRASGVAWWDNVGVQFQSVALGASLPLPARMVLSVQAEGGRWEQSQGAVMGAIEFGNVRARMQFELWDSVTPEFTVGLEGDSVGNVASFGSLGVRISLFGKVFGRVFLSHDRHRVSYESTLIDVRAYGPGMSLYAEPLRWLFAATEASVYYITDDNVRGRALLAVGIHNWQAFQIEPRIFAQYDGYRDIRVNASPYFTPADPWTIGADLTARYTLVRRVRAEVSAGMVYQAGHVAFRPRGLLELELFRHLRLDVSAGYVGSALYNQLRFDAALAWLF